MLEERPSKKQREVFNYIETFINENGFGPSYREIMRALGLKSVSTVATHVNGLIAKGMLVKKDNSARSLQVVQKEDKAVAIENNKGHIEWLRQEIARREANPELFEEVKTLKAALKVLDQSEN